MMVKLSERTRIHERRTEREEQDPKKKRERGGRISRQFLLDIDQVRPGLGLIR